MDYVPYAVPYISITYLFYNVKFVSFDTFIRFLHLLSFPLAITNLFSVPIQKI